ncbi:peptide/nickel transport system permease protein [Thalassobacillus cyri]|uniref:Peptide/nickel transport system permease protein n=1 Tax=Thalassobacillus cyri TaxID=571932 RepID=A0A1H3ZQS3_9BACI|nr:ABC transporter permease subunit [Thalassobacillus cyri]SEA26067.1 peptide/nickel transport system permease protein [Thalassobacillus cyri]
MKWGSYIAREVTKPLFLIVGIFIVSVSPLFMYVEGFVWPGLQVFTNVWKQLMEPGSLIYVNPTSGVERDLFPFILKAFESSMTILGIALSASFCIALLGTILLWRAPKKVYNAFVATTSFLQSIPDIVFVVAAQMLLVWLYQKTGINVAKVSGAGAEEAVLAPAVVLAVLPTMYFFQSMLELVEEERKEHYYELAVSKGLSKSYILFMHILRNMFVRLAYQAKFLVSIMISNLLIIEYLFNNLGMTSFLLDYSQPPVFFVTALLFFIPIYLFLKLIELVLYWSTKQEVSL